MLFERNNALKLKHQQRKKSWKKTLRSTFYLQKNTSRIQPLQSVPEAPYDRRAVRACDWLAHGTADVMQHVIAALHRHFHPGDAFVRIQGPGSHSEVLDTHIVIPEENKLHFKLSSSFGERERFRIRQMELYYIVVIYDVVRFIFIYKTEKSTVIKNPNTVINCLTFCSMFSYQSQ